MTYTEANLLPKKHIVNKQYQDFLDTSLAKKAT